MLALPALLSNGFLSHNSVFDFDEGYYSLISIQLSLAFAFHLRMESVEKISKTSPGELGKIIGLDRIPEAKTFRQKIETLSGNNQSQNWLNELSSDWMQQNTEFAGVLYIDGHEKVYSGKQKLPRRFISRMRLALRAVATTGCATASDNPSSLSIQPPMPP